MASLGFFHYAAVVLEGLSENWSLTTCLCELFKLRLFGILWL
jgi:hypothetical protein